ASALTATLASGATVGAPAWTGFDTTAKAVEAAPAALSTTAVAIGDVNGDGFNDLVIGSKTGPPELYLNQGKTTGPTPTWKGLATTGTTIGTTGDAAFTGDTVALTLVDLNGDKKLDLIVAESGTTSDVYINTGTGFGSATPLTTAAGATSIAVADVSGDALPDLVVGETASPPELFVNLGQGSSGWLGFKPPTTLGNGTPTASGVALSNVDPANGQLDLLLTQSSGALEFYEGMPLPVTRIGFNNVTATLPGATVNAASGALIIEPGTSGGLAGVFSGTVTAGSSSVGGTVNASVRFNSTTESINDTVVVNGTTIPIVFNANASPPEDYQSGKPYVSISGSGSVNLGPFLEIEGSFSWDNSPTGPKTPSSPITVFLGQGPAFLSNNAINPNAQGVYFTVTSYEDYKGDGGFAFYATGTIKIAGVSGLTLSASNVTLLFNTTNDDQFTTGTGHVTIPKGSDSVTADGLSLGVSGVTLTGDFGFTYTSSGFTVLIGAAAPGGTSASLNLGPLNSNGTTYPLTVTIGSGSLTMGSAGVFGEIDGLSPTLNVPGINFPNGVSADLKVNT
ncbi:MAG: VCBS repeat-containing protein, partial [Solirubrobacteraceae bacterium]